MTDAPIEGIPIEETDKNGTLSRPIPIGGMHGVDEQQKNDVLSRPIPQYMLRMARFAQPWQLRRPRLWAGLHIVLGCLFAGLGILAFIHHIYVAAAMAAWLTIVDFAYGWLLMVIPAGDAKSRRNGSP